MAAVGIFLHRNGRLGEYVLLNVARTVMGWEDKDPVIRTSVIEEPVSTADHERLVAAISRALETLIREIVEVIDGLETM